MEKITIDWQLIGIVGSFCGIIFAMMKWYGDRLHSSFDKLVDNVNEHTTIIKIEQRRNDDQDEQLDKHSEDIEEIKEVIYQVKYRKA